MALLDQRGEFWNECTNVEIQLFYPFTKFSTFFSDGAFVLCFIDPFIQQ